MASSSTDERVRRLAPDAHRRLEVVQSRGEQGRLALEQVKRAAAAATTDVEARDKGRVRFIPRCLHRITGYLPKGSLAILAAQTGLGKSTFLMSVLDDWIEAGYTVSMLGLEQEDWELRTQYACLRSGVPKQVALTNSWDEEEDGQAMHTRLHTELVRQLEEPLIDRLLFFPDRYLSLDALEQAAEEAKDLGSDILIVDHLNHMEGSSDPRELKRIVQRAKALAEQYKLLVLAAAQINRASYQGGHRLTRYMPAQLQHIMGGSAIEQNAVVVLNLWRPVIVPVDKREKALIEMAKKGEIEPSLVLQPMKMGVVDLKNRIDGSLESKRCVLQLEPNGKLFDPMDT
jgi:replicative DNA helicase